MVAALPNVLYARWARSLRTRFGGMGCAILLLAMGAHSVLFASPLPVQVGSAQVWQRHSRYDAGPLPTTTHLQNLTVILRSRAPAELQEFLAAVQYPASPQYHHWLTPEEFSARFGASPAGVAQVEAWLRSGGMTGIHSGRGGLWIEFSGSSGAVEALLNTEMRAMVANGVPHFANRTSPAVPPTIAPFIAGFAGLDDFGPQPQTVHAAAARGNTITLGAPAFASVYGLSGLYAHGFTGESMNIAILGRTPVQEDDVRAYRAQFHLPQNDFQAVAVPGSTGTDSALDEEEATFDLEVASGAAPAANLLYVWGSTLDAAAEWAIDNRIATILSESYAGCENTGDVFYQTLAMQASAEGITWLSAAGDSGAAACDAPGAPAAQFGLHASAPAATPDITAVGGTALQASPGSVQSGSAGDGTRSISDSQITETGWSSLSAVTAGGGGISQVFGRPGYQSDFAPADIAGRMLPDVSFAASPNDSPYSVLFHGQSELVGGTSMATPLLAGILALVNESLISQDPSYSQGLGEINPILYRLSETGPTVFHDIVDGSNDVPCVANSPDCKSGAEGYAAEPGYDLATGLGSVDATELASSWTSATFTPSNATLAVSAGKATAEQPVQIIARVTSQGAPVGGSPVQFYLKNATWQPNQILVATVSSDSSGTAIYTTDDLPAGSNSIEAIATGTSSVSAASPVSVLIDIAGIPSTVQVQKPDGDILAGQTIPLSVRVSVDNGDLQGSQDVEPCATNGTVSLYAEDGSLQAGPVTLDALASASLTLPALPSGTASYSVAYSGNCYVAPSRSPSFTLTATAANPPDFVLSGPAAATMNSNSSGSITLSITPVNGFAQAVQFTCSTSSQTATCTVPQTVKVNGTTQVSVAIACSSSNMQLAAMGFLLLVLKRRGRSFGVRLALLFLPLIILTSCGGASHVQQAASSVAVTITAVSGSITHSVSIPVTVVP